jgi:hypothetical protein
MKVIKNTVMMPRPKELVKMKLIVKNYTFFFILYFIATCSHSCKMSCIVLVHILLAITVWWHFITLKFPCGSCTLMMEHGLCSSGLVCFANIFMSVCQI